MTRQKWKKLGHVFVADQHHPWMMSHAATPFPMHVKDDVFRIYFSTRDVHNRSSISYVDFALSQPERILSIASRPVLLPGPQGLYDDSGLSMMQILETQEKRYLYYIGWNLSVIVPFRNSIGLAIAPLGSDEFIRYANAPVLDRSAVDPFSLSSSWIMVEDGVWRMWYGSHIAWDSNDLDMQYTLKYAESTDGINWRRTGHICIPLYEYESAIVRPSVIKEGGWYHMWYSRRLGRKETCSIGYSISRDGIHWDRQDDQIDITASKEGWDSEMLCYPCVFDHAGSRYMVYNGNKFGKTGFGLAVLES